MNSPEATTEASTRIRLLVNHFSWIGGVQLISRVVRLLTIVVVARILFPEDYGLAALVLAANEIFHSVSHGSVSSKLVQASASEVDDLKSTVYWMSWLLCVVLALLQTASAYPMAVFYQQPDIVIPLCLLSLSYLMLSMGTVQNAMLIRERRLDVVARGELYQALIETLLTLVLALADFGFWALVLPKLIVVPVWLLYVRSHYVWSANYDFQIVGWQRVLRFGMPIALNDLLFALRTHVSALLIGGILGIEALGVFYFASNAGLGIAMSLVRALNQVFFTHFCRDCRMGDGVLSEAQFRSGLVLGLCLIGPFVLMQTVFAPLYVPLVFGERWVEAGAIPILVLLCLSAIPLPLASVATQALRATDQAMTDFWMQLVYAVLFMIAMSVGVCWGLQGVAISTVCVNFIFCPVFVWWVWHKIRSNERVL